MAHNDGIISLNSFVVFFSHFNDDTQEDLNGAVFNVSTNSVDCFYPLESCGYDTYKCVRFGTLPHRMEKPVHSLTPLM